MRLITKSFLSLLIKIPFFILLTIIIILNISLYLIYNNQKNQIHNEIINSSNFMLSTLEYSITLLTKNNEFDKIQNLIDKLTSYPSINEICIFDINYKIIASSMHREVGKIKYEMTVKNIINDKLLKSIEENINNNIYKIAVPIEGDKYNITRNDALQYILYLSVNVLFQKKYYSRFLITTIFQNTLLFVSVLIVIIIVIYLFVFSPLSKFKNIVSELLNGNLGIRINIKQKDEFYTLAGLFNNMLEEMQIKNQQLNDYANNLEAKVYEKTYSLKESHQKLTEAYLKLKSTQSKLIQSDKLASIGQLAAGIAHEINNPNAFVKNNIEVLSDYLNNLSSFINELSDSELNNNIIKKYKINEIINDMPQLIKDSLKGTNRIENIVKSMKGFVHIDKEEKEIKNIHEILDNILLLCWNEIKYKVEVVKKYTDVPLIPCYPMQLGQVFMNIIINASHAIKEKGIIKISTYIKEKFVVTDIEDNGCGIPLENLFKIFDPFFTTKEVGKGTGLGLSIAYDIMNAHNGFIEVKSEVDKGSIFSIFLPID